MTVPRTERAPPLADALPRLAGDVTRAEGLLVVFDFDGTLASDVADPTDPTLPSGTLARLRSLRDRADVEVAITSARSLADLRSRVGLDGVTYAANGGLDRWHDGVRSPHPVAEHCRGRVGAACERLRAKPVTCHGIEVVDRGLTALVRHDASDPGTVEKALAAASDVAAAADLVLVPRSDGIQLRPDVGWDRGHLVRSLTPAGSDGPLVCYLGGRPADEPAFAAVGHDGFSVTVGEGRDSAADYRLPDPSAVESFVAWLVERTGQSAATVGAEPALRRRST